MSKKISQLTELTTVLSGDVFAVVNSGQTKKVTKANLLKEVNAAILLKSDLIHTHDDRYYTESEITTLLLAKQDALGFVPANIVHTHDDRYYTETETNILLAGKSDTSHTHAGVYEPANANIQTHISSTFNPHSVTKSQVGLGSVDNTSDLSKPISTATQTALDLKAPIASPTFTGTVSGITKTMVGLGNVDNTSDANKPVSTAQQTALNLKANLTGAVFSGAISSTNLSGTHTGTSSGTNTGDQDLSSYATNASVALKVSKAGDTMTGNLGITIPIGGNTTGLTVTQNDTTNNPIGINVASASVGNDRHGIQSVLNGVITSSFQGGVFSNITNAASTNGYSFYAGHNGSGGSGFRMWYAGSGGVHGVNLLHDNASALGSSLVASHAGGAFNSGGMLALNHSNTGTTIYANQNVTNKNWSSGHGIELTGRSTVNDAGTYTKSSSLVNLTAAVTETSGVITDTAQVLDINQTHADATGNVVDIANDGAGRALRIGQNLAAGTANVLEIVNSGLGNAIDIANSLSATALNIAVVNTNKRAVNINNTGAQTTLDALVRVKQSSASTTVPVMELETDATTGGGLLVDNNGNGKSIDIDHDGNSASAISGLWVNVANAGVGGAYAAIFEAGKVTIGTSSGSELLSVAGNVKIGATQNLLLADLTTYQKIQSYSGTYLHLNSEGNSVVVGSGTVGTSYGALDVMGLTNVRGQLQVNGQYTSRSSTFIMSGKNTADVGGVYFAQYVDADNAIVGNRKWSLYGYLKKTTDGTTYAFEEFIAASFPTTDGTSTYTKQLVFNTNTYINGLFAFYGFTSASPALKRSAAQLHVRLADDSAYGELIAGKIGIGTSSTSAMLTLPAGTATANTAPLKFTSGTALTTPADGAMEYHGSHLYFTIGSTRYQLDQQSGSGTVTSVSVITANGVSGSVATSTTTPAITLTLGAITPSSVVASGSVTGSNLSGTNTGDETTATIKTKLSITTLSGSNTGDQTSIVGITGTTAQFNTALTDNDFATLAGIETLTNKTLTAPVISTITNTGTLTLPTTTGTLALVSQITGTNSGTNTGDETTATIKTKLGITILSGFNTGDQTSIVGITGTKAQFDTAVTDGNIVFTNQATTGQYGSARYSLTDGATISLDWNNGNVQSVTLGGNRTFTFANPIEGGRYLIALKQDATGSRTITWPTITWQGGAAPTLTTTANKTDLITLIYANGIYHGSSSLNY